MGSQKNTIGIYVILLSILGVLVFQVANDKGGGILTGSVEQSHEYYSTTTRAALFPAVYTLKAGPGAVGNVTITGAAAGAIRLYDATTSNALLRAPSKATTSLLIADFPNSTAAGTYVLDIRLNDGLLIETSGTIPTTTVTWR